jgi:ferredoxin
MLEYATYFIAVYAMSMCARGQFLTKYNATMNSPDMPLLYIGKTQPDDQQFDAWTHQPLLHSLEQGGIDWPSSCRNGTCRTCIGQLASGVVRYEIEWPGLSTEEIDQGYVLPCVAHPCTDVVLQPETGCVSN